MKKGKCVRCGKETDIDDTSGDCASCHAHDISTEQSVSGGFHSNLLQEGKCIRCGKVGEILKKKQLCVDCFRKIELVKLKRQQAERKALSRMNNCYRVLDMDKTIIRPFQSRPFQYDSPDWQSNERMVVYELAAEKIDSEEKVKKVRKGENNDATSEL